ncbi:MAG: alpha/beta hydrolase [Myxococcales bacterium]|nr:alpha/beta hydrolase [Myxococcales bacterium]
MARYAVNGISIEVEQHGEVRDPAILLLRGLGTQLVQWPPLLLETLVQAGFRVVTFDNRDVGLSDKIDQAGELDLPSIMQGQNAPPYTLQDMALDTVGVLDALEVAAAHVVGISMGGMIAQRVAATHPDRCLSMTSIMSSSGAPGLPTGTPEATATLLARPADPDDREAVIAQKINSQRTIGSPDYPMTDRELRSYSERAYDRCHAPDGVARQLAAVLGDGSRVELLRTIRVPALVIHGRDDPLVPLAAGEDTARHIPRCKLEIIAGMGHDVTAANTPLLAKLLIAHARAAG